MVIYHDKIEKKSLGKGILLQELGHGEKLNVLHWNLEDNSEVPVHVHSEEQFGYVIKGGFELVVGEEKFILKKDDAYFIPPNVPHGFITIGETEAIDIFTPIKTEFPWKK